MMGRSNKNSDVGGGRSHKYLTVSGVGCKEHGRWFGVPSVHGQFAVGQFAVKKIVGFG